MAFKSEIAFLSQKAFQPNILFFKFDVDFWPEMAIFQSIERFGLLSVSILARPTCKSSVNARPYIITKHCPKNINYLA